MITKIGAVMFALMGTFCVPSFIYVAVAPFWPRVGARVVSNVPLTYQRSIEGSNETETVATPDVRVAYDYRDRTYERSLGNAGSLQAVRPGDLIDIRVCPAWPSWACPDLPMHPLARLLGAIAWGGLIWGLMLAARAVWLH